MGWKNIKDHYKIGHHVQVVPGKGICIGSGYIHDIIVLSETGEFLKRYSGSNEDLNRYQTEMNADPAKLATLIAEPDVFSTSLPVYTFDDGRIKEFLCAEYGWPNCTHDGQMMYDNTFSSSKDEVIKWALEDLACAIKCDADRIQTLELELEDARANRAKNTEAYSSLSAQYPAIAKALESNG
ncbi:hypothetical protein [Marinobacterium sp. BA1]|uniref:hypothetical protein n=1 Tax=Marinobacterium sp. BA1 TaxID=3138931 RepID=UPI0032E5FE8F